MQGNLIHPTDLKVKYSRSPIMLPVRTTVLHGIAATSYHHQRLLFSSLPGHAARWCLPPSSCLGPTILSSAPQLKNGHSQPSAPSTLLAPSLQATRPFSSRCPFPPPSRSASLWIDELNPQPLDLEQQVYCNRSLNMKQIKAVGFDMDYTLASYKAEAFEGLAHQQTVKKLVEVFGYPKMLYDLQFDWTYMMRGLVIDKKRGNVLKVDRHKYVKVAMHGFTKLSSGARNSVYNKTGGRDSFDEPDYAMIDTLFSLAEAHIYMQLVALKDEQPETLKPGKTYLDLYKDVRASVDLIHRDGSLKRAVAADPAKYIYDDPLLPRLLDSLRATGKQTFLATNSLWDYTNVVMNYVLEGRTGADRDHSWLRHFDVVVVGCGKPKFFSEKHPLFEVQVETGMLRNTDNGAPITPVDEQDLPNNCRSTAPAPAATLTNGTGMQPRASVWQGGNYRDLHKILGVNVGCEVLYVGDHIYGDILRSKKSLGWRTCLVAPELALELQDLPKSRSLHNELSVLRQQRERLDDMILRLKWKLRNGSGDANGTTQTALEDLEAQQQQLKARHSQLLEEDHNSFHPVWGRLLKTGYQNSQYAHQLERFACLYTSHVSNMAFYSPNHNYRGRMDHMAHEDVVDSWQRSSLQ